MKRVLLVGLGGLGSAAAPCLVRAGMPGADIALTLVDPDRVERTNLHRQLLYRPADIGRLKVEVAAERLRALGARAVLPIAERFEDCGPHSVSEHDLVIEGTDSFATKFAVADACARAGVPAVQGGALRFQGWALSTHSTGRPCLRCVFEQGPRTPETCVDAGAMGPMIGLVGTMQAALALRLLDEEASPARPDSAHSDSAYPDSAHSDSAYPDSVESGALFHVDGLRMRPRTRPVHRRPGCACEGLHFGRGSAASL